MHEHGLSWKIRNYPGHPSRASRQALKPQSFQFLSDPGKPPAARSYFNLITDQKNPRSLAVLEFGVSPHTLEIKGSQIGLDTAKPIFKLCYSGPCSSKLQPALASILQILPEFCSSTHFKTPNPANESPFPAGSRSWAGHKGPQTEISYVKKVPHFEEKATLKGLANMRVAGPLAEHCQLRDALI